MDHRDAQTYLDYKAHRTIVGQHYKCRGLLEPGTTVTQYNTIVCFYSGVNMNWRRRYLDLIIISVGMYKWFSRSKTKHTHTPHLAQGAILSANFLLRQKPAPPVANQ